MSEATQRAYEQLAERSERQRDARQRDVFLALAADAAFTDGRRDDAERLRGRLLQVSPHSLLRPYNSFGEALQSSDIQDYLADLRVLYPPERAQNLLKETTDGEPAPRQPMVFNFKEPAAETPVGVPAKVAVAQPAPRRGRPPSRSPYEPAAPVARSEDRDRSGALVIGLLVLAMLGLGAASLWFAVVEPLLRS